MIVLALVTIGLTLVWADDHASSHARDDNDSSRLRLVSESALLAGLEGKTVFPFIDTTPKGLRQCPRRDHRRPAQLLRLARRPHRIFRFSSVKRESPSST